MNTMFLAGTGFWVIELIALFWFLYECRDDTTKKGYILKGAVSSNILFYGTTLVLLYRHFTGEPVSRGAMLFLIGLFFAFLGDMGLATMQRTHGGSSKAIFLKISSEHVTAETLTAGVVGVLFIISFFFQTVAFLNGIHGDIQRFGLPFLLFFLIPPVFALVAGSLLAAQQKVPEVSTNIFIIAVFFILLTSALFASASIYSFWVWPDYPNHAIFVFMGVAVFGLSLFMLAMRYLWPNRFDTRAIRGASRLLNYIARMIIAGCAFLF